MIARWVILIRLVWVLLVAGLTLVMVRVAAANFVLVHRLCSGSGTSCVGTMLTERQWHGLQAAGVSQTAYVTYFDIVNILFVAVFVLVAGTIMWRRGRDRMTILSAFILVTFGATTFTDAANVVRAVDSSWWLPVAILSSFGSGGMMLFLFLFPDGRFVPRWTVLPAAAWFVVQIARYFDPGSPLVSHSSLVALFPWIVVFGSVIYAQIYRYRSVSTPVQRQQTKWVLWCFSVALSIFVGLISLISLDSGATTTGLGFLAIFTAIYLVISLIPLSVGFAMLRYRLWDVDVLINRTLVYLALTASLALLYFGSVVLLQALLRHVSGQGSNLAIAISTLAIAAAFQPFRRRLQGFIDRRFYRRKFDATQTVMAFQTKLRDEVDLDQLVADIVSVVQETVQPASISLWVPR